MVGINTSMSGLPVQWEKRIQKSIPHTFIVDKNGRGHFHTIQDALDAAHAAEGGSAYNRNTVGRIYIRKGVYNESVTSACDYVWVEGESWEAKIDGTGVGSAFTSSRGVCNLCNIHLYTTPGAGGTYHTYVDSSQGGNHVRNIYISGSDEHGMAIVVGTKVYSCYINDPDGNGINASAETNVSASSMTTCGNWGFQGDGTTDNAVVVGCNFFSNTSGDISLHNDDENCVIVGNRCNSTTTISDASGSSTVSGNDTT